MNLHQLNYFQVLAKIGNVSRAAEELVLSQSALSRSISRLEEELGIPLFERKSRGMVLNRYGEIFLMHTHRALREIDKAKQEINNIINPFHGTVSLGFIQPLGSSFVPELISKFQEEAPGIHFHLTQDTTKGILSQIESAEIDVAFCSLYEPQENIHSYPIMNQELFLIVHKEHRLVHREQVDLSEVADEPFILYRPETSMHDVIEKLCVDAGFHPTKSFEAYDERTVAGLVGAKLGVALVPFVDGLDLEKVSVIRVRKPRCLIGIQMVWRSYGYISPALDRFIAYVESAFS